MPAAAKMLLFWACPGGGGAAFLLPLGQELLKGFGHVT